MILCFCVVVLSSCGVGPLNEHSRYEPVPDRELFAQIDALSGVEEADVRYTKAGASSTYRGDVDVERGADPLEVADQVFAILHQGRWRALVDLTFVQDGEIVELPRNLWLGPTSRRTDRYGPQPGDGTPPGD